MRAAARLQRGVGPRESSALEPSGEEERLRPLGTVVPPENSIGVDFREHGRWVSANEIGQEARTAWSRPLICPRRGGKSDEARTGPFRSRADRM